MTSTAEYPPGGPTTSRELDHLLDVGPFPAALRAAIGASGLSLDRIQHRLQARGVRLSVATLSYWQSDRRRPERPASMHALTHLEQVLHIPRGSLAALLGPPRPRGRRNGSDHLPTLDQLWTKQEIAQTLLSTVDTSSDLLLRRLSQHDRITVGADRKQHALRSRQLLRAEADGPDRCLLMFDWDYGHEDEPALSGLRNCSLGKIVTHPDDGIFLTELVFDRPLNRGETQLLEYAVHTDARHSTAARADQFSRKFRHPTREYFLEVDFDPQCLPARAHQQIYASDNLPGKPQARNLSISPHGQTHMVALDFGPGEVGIRWEWDR
ncbi:MAG: hypothetical protein ACRDRL_21365 [Sciscionella sp.]